MKRRITVAFILVTAVGCGNDGERPAPAAVEPMGPVYAEIAPAVYLPGSPCGLVLQDEVEGAPSTVLASAGGMAALTVCGNVGGEWVEVEGAELDVEGLSGQARVLPGPPPSASILADAPARLEALGVGHVRLVATFGELEGGGVLEIVAE